MGLLRLSGFTGFWPVRDSRVLPDNAAIAASNLKVDGGAYVRGINGPSLIKTLASTTRAVFRIPLPGANTLANSYWMEFPDIDTNVLRAPIVNDSYERFYWASPSTGLKYAPKGQIIAGAAALDVGVPAPATALTAAAVAGTGALDPTTGKNTAPILDRSYVVTFISEYGEEGQPGPATDVTGASDQDYLLTNIPQPGAPGTRAAYQKIRLYRTVTGETGVAAFYKVVDLDIGTTNYTDRIPDTTVSGQTLLASTSYGLPPAMDGLVAMPNGIFVGWKGTTLFFSENFRPHAWPAEYQITVDFPIVGCGVFGNTLVVCTTGNPVAVSGTVASAMTVTKVDTPLPCLSRGSIVSQPEGVYWTSEFGIARFGADGINVVTQGVVARDEWNTAYSPRQQRAAVIAGKMMVCRPDPDTAADTDGFMFIPSNVSQMGISNFKVASGILNIGIEPWTGKPWIIGEDFKLYEWEVPDVARLSWFWMSKEFKLPFAINFSIYEAYFDSSVADGLHLRVWAWLRGNDGTVVRTLIYDQPVPISGQPVRLPSGFKSDVWQVELSGDAELQSFAAATSIAELRSD